MFSSNIRSFAFLNKLLSRFKTFILNLRLNNKQFGIKRMIAILAIILFFAFDRILKYFAVTSASLPKNIFGELLKFNFYKNYNIAFSLPFNKPLLNFTIIAIIICLIYYSLKSSYKKYSLFLFLIIFGAISNLFDRLKYGYVIDYLDFKHFTVFNVADTMITCGVIGLIYLILKEKINKNPQYIKS